MKLIMGICSCCGRNKPIVNRKRFLCNLCNRDRLGTSVPSNAIRAARPRGISDKGKAMIKKDEEFYELVWNSKPHYCEECGIWLGDDFRDNDGKVIDRFRYSHILPKGGRYGIFRHRLENMNLLCLIHHQQWEDGKNVESMKIYIINTPIIKMLHAEMAERNKF